MRLNQAAFAKVIGVSAPAIAKHVRSGKIVIGDDGLLDVEAACAAIGRKLTDARREHAARLEKAAGYDARRTPAAAGESPDTLAFNAARAKRETIKAEREGLELRRFKKELLDAGQAYARMFDFYRTQRDHITNWPARVVAIMAAEVGCDARKLMVVMEREVNTLLHELSRINDRRDRLLDGIC